MTIKEAFIQELAGLKVAEGLIDLSLLRAKISNSSANYEPNLHDEMIEVASMFTLYSLWGTIERETEGDATNVFDIQGRKEKLLYLAKKYGRRDIVEALDDKPTIKAIRRW